MFELVTRTGKGITHIDYNPLILPKAITFGQTGSIQFVYAANGQKMRKILTSGTAPASEHDYCGGIEYKNGLFDALYHSEGRVRDVEGFIYEYTLRDHLGNGRVYYTDQNNDGVATVTDILQDNHYYPFGLNIDDPRRGSGAPENLYQYNGKELNRDLGLDWNDYGARWKDEALGRWWSVDPLADKYFSLSPFVYVANNPLILIDPDGRLIKGVTVNENGSVQFSKKASKDTRAVYAAMSKSETGLAQFMKMVNSETKIDLLVVDYELQGGVHGITDGRGKTKNGNYKKAYVTISTAKTGDRFDNATDEEIINAVGAHEAEHATSVTQREKDESNPNSWEAETGPISVEYTSRTEYNNGDNSKFKDAYETPNPDALDTQKKPYPGVNLIEKRDEK